MSAVFLVLSAFLASAVEMVEALTIVLAAGLTRGWRSTLIGVGAAVVVLAAIVGALGPALTLIPLDALRLTVGGLLLIFGLQWLRKAILRASGFKALHDEEAIFARELEDARSAKVDVRGGLDWYAFTLSFKGVLLEGLEVAFIVLTFGATQGNIGLAAIGAGAAIVIVAGVGVAVRAPLARVPENAMKFTVGIMLSSFGTFWAAEGAGAHWPGSDASLAGVLVVMIAVSAASSRCCAGSARRPRPRPRRWRHDRADRRLRPVLVGLRGRRRLVAERPDRGRDRGDRRDRGRGVQRLVGAPAGRRARALRVAAARDARLTAPRAGRRGTRGRAARCPHPAAGAPAATARARRPRSPRAARCRPPCGRRSPG